MGDDFSSYFKANSNIPSYRENTGMQSYIAQNLAKEQLLDCRVAHTVFTANFLTREMCIFAG